MNAFVPPDRHRLRREPSRPRRRAIAAVGMALVWLAAGPVATATAATACVYNPATDTVTIQIDPGESAGLAIETAAADLDAESAAGAILFDNDGAGLEDGANSTQCGSATDGNTVGIVVLGDDDAERLTIDDRAGAVFGPSIDWAVDLGPSGPDAIEILGAEAGDDVVVGDGSFSIDGAAGVLLGAERFLVEGNGGDDTIDGSSLGPASALVALGGPGDDAVSPGAGDDDLDGGDGTDALDWSAGTLAIAIDMATGIATGHGTDAFTQFESVVGSSGNDVLLGDDRTNDLIGGSGDDVLDGRGGSDHLDGGLGTDHCELDATDPTPSSCESGAEPQISGVSPASGPPGTAVTISGSRLGGATRVVFGTVQAGFVQLSDTQISATVPDLSPAGVDVRVETPSGTSATGTGTRFAVEPNPSSSPSPSQSPGSSPSSSPGGSPSQSPTASPSDSPTPGSTVTPSRSPSVSPSAGPGAIVPTPSGGPPSPSMRPSDPTRTPVPPPPEHTWADSVPTADEIGWDVAAALASLAAVGFGTLVFLFVPFPSQPFNGALQESYDRFVARPRRALARLMPRLHGRPADVLSYVAAVSVSALLYAWLDPAFGATGDAATTYLGLVVALVAVTMILSAADVLFMWIRRHELGVLRGYGWALPVAAVCVAISRFADFQPGYLYGAIAGLAFAAKLEDEEEGRRIAVSAVWVVIAGVVAFVARTPIHDAAVVPGADAAVEVADTALAALLVACMEWLAFGLVPITFLPGKALKAWNPWLWAGFMGAGVFTFVYVLAYGETDYLSSAPFRTTVILFAAFGVASAALWVYVKAKVVRRQPQSR